MRVQRQGGGLMGHTRLVRSMATARPSPPPTHFCPPPAHLCNQHTAQAPRLAAGAVNGHGVSHQVLQQLRVGGQVDLAGARAACSTVKGSSIDRSFRCRATPQSVLAAVQGRPAERARSGAGPHRRAGSQRMFGCGGCNGSAVHRSVRRRRRRRRRQQMARGGAARFTNKLSQTRPAAASSHLVRCP